MLLSLYLSFSKYVAGDAQAISLVLPQIDKGKQMSDNEREYHRPHPAFQGGGGLAAGAGDQQRNRLAAPQADAFAAAFAHDRSGGEESEPPAPALAAAQPPTDGLYESRFEHDSCGIGMIVNIQGQRSHQLVLDAIAILEALTHRGGVGYEPDTGDGAGILLQMPEEFMRRVAACEGIELPAEPGSYGVAMLFASPDEDRLQKSLNSFASIIRAEGLRLLGIREVPVSSGCVGPTAAAVRPAIRQVFIGQPETPAGGSGLDAAAFERRLYIVAQQARRQIRLVEHGADPYFYLASCSAQTIVYK